MLGVPSSDRLNIMEDRLKSLDLDELLYPSFLFF